MTSALLYRTFYVLVHFIFNLYEWFEYAFVTLHSLIVDFYHEFGGARRTKQLKNEIERKNKIPKHLTVLLGKEEPSYRDLANVVLWCLVNRIVFLSLYDYKGTLKKHQEKLEKEVNRKVPPNDHIIWHNNPGSTYKNGFTGRKIHIKILSPENSKENIANITKSLCKRQNSDLTIDQLDRMLQQDFEFPEPDLGLNCGEHLMFLHYPPWQIRVTEFLTLRSHHRLRYQTFLEKLAVFAKCEQRLGK